MDQAVDQRWIRAIDLDSLKRTGNAVAHLEGASIALFYHQDAVYAVDNRCPHMGFPLQRGSVNDCILTCHWHHARFDLATGGTFDLWADDVRAYPVKVCDNDVFVDVTPQGGSKAALKQRLTDGMERDIALVIGKSVISLMSGDSRADDAFRTGLEFGTRYRRAGWGQGLTILTCMRNLVDSLEPEERSRAMYHGLSATSRDSAGAAPRFPIRPLPSATTDLAQLKRWFRQFVEVRDSDGAERCIASAIHAGADDKAMADMLFAAVTDHRYIQIGHVLDFTNKAFEALDRAGWDLATETLGSLAMAYAGAGRMEENNAWRQPIDLVAILESAFERLPAALEAGRASASPAGARDELLTILHADDPAGTVAALLSALESGVCPEDLAGTVAYAAALRIARFGTTNEFGDWDTALHTFTFANAVHQGLKRSVSPELLRGVFDAAMSVYLDRFLNMPAARLPELASNGTPINEIVSELEKALDRQQQVNRAGELVAQAVAGGHRDGIKAALGRLLLREDREFHTIQCIEAAFRQSDLLVGTPESTYVLVAAARYLAAHAPTVRAQGQTYLLAQRLCRGDRLFEDE
jgi:nitrite reductase/ring-hydroxylating ferredoxin subunit